MQFWHPVPAQGPGLEGRCALPGWCFTASAASVRQMGTRMFLLLLLSKPQKMPFGPSASALKNKQPEEEYKSKKIS